MTKPLVADVVIVGGGLAGIATALESLDGGLSVLLLERAPEERFGGLAKRSFGGMFFVDTPEQRRSRIHDSADLALADWKAYAEFGYKPGDLSVTEHAAGELLSLPMFAELEEGQIRQTSDAIRELLSES